MAKSIISGLTVTIGADTKNFKKALSEINAEARNVANDLKIVNEQLKLNPTSTVLLTDKLNLLKEASNNAAKKVELYNKAIDELNKMISEGKISQDDYQKSISELSRGLESANRAYTLTNQRISDFTKETGLSKVNVERVTALISDFNAKMSDLDNEAKVIASDLAKVNAALKIDPKDTEAAYQKMKLLGDAVANTTAKVDTIKEAIKKLNDEYDDKSSEEYTVQLKALERQLESATNEQNLAVSALDEYQRSVRDADKPTEELTEEIKDLGKSVDKAGDEQKETNKQIKDMKSATDQASTGAKSLGQSIQKFIGSSAVQTALKTAWNLAKNIARELVNAGKEIFNFAKSSVELAAQYHDAVETSKRAFQEFADDAIAFAEKNSVALGLYKGDMLEAMNSLGLMFSSMGLGRKEAEQMSERVVILAADLRAAFGGDMKEILDALSRGLSTSTRNLRQFGVYISEAEIKAYALSKGIVQTTVDQTKLNRALIDCEKAEKALSEAILKYGEDSIEARDAEQKLLEKTEKLNEAMEGQADAMSSAEREAALLGLTEERLADIQGQAEAEANKYPALVNRIDAAFKNMRETIGERLLPTFEKFLSQFLEFLQSDEGQKILDSIADAFENIGKKVEKILEDGSLQNLIDKLITDLPQISTDIGTFIEKVIELIPQISDLTEKLLNLFGIETEASKAKKAFKDVKDEIEFLALSYGVSTEQMRGFVSLWAQENGVKLSEVYGDWETYEPKINTWMETLKTDTSIMGDAYEQELNKLPEYMQNAVDKGASIDWTAADSFREKVRGWAHDIIGWFKGVGEWVQNPGGWKDDFELNPPVMSGNDPYGNDYDGMNPYIPSDYNGYSSFGGRSVTNSVNNSRTVGDVVINVVSQGMDLSTVADELGQAIQNKLRMSGAML